MRGIWKEEKRPRLWSEGIRGCAISLAGGLLRLNQGLHWTPTETICLILIPWSTFDLTYFKTTHFKPTYSLPESIVELVTSHLMTGKFGVGKLQLAEQSSHHEHHNCLGKWWWSAQRHPDDCWYYTKVVEALSYTKSSRMCISSSKSKTILFRSEQEVTSAAFINMASTSSENPGAASVWWL